MFGRWMPASRAVAAGATACVALALSCRSGASGEPEKAAASGGAAQAESPQQASSKVRPMLAPPQATLPRWRVPVGPVLGILAGKGLGPIRFGATLATIERHMQAPCTEKVQGKEPGELTCRYGPHAVEFFLRDGVLARVYVHGRNRLFSAKDHITYGLFRGGFVEGARLGMIPSAVQEYIGAPTRVERAPADHPYGAEEIHTYPGMVLEYNRAAGTGKLVLSGVIIEPMSGDRGAEAPHHAGGQSASATGAR